jgi:hypothetical protein
MPKVGAKKYPYTAKGMAAARKEANKTGRKIANIKKKKASSKA